MSAHRSLVDDVCAVVRAGRVDGSGHRLELAVDSHLDRLAPLLAAEPRRAAREQVLARLLRLGALEAWLADPDVTEVAVNAGSQVWVDRHGRMEHVASLAHGEIDGLVERIIGPLGLRFDRTSPIVDARLADGARLCAVMAPLAVDGTCVSIRRFALREVVVAAFAPPDVVELLRELVEAKCNVLVSGPTSAGKTTFLNALVALVPGNERIITIEDTAELRLHSDHVVRLEARRGTPDGVAEVSVRDLVRAALRLRPDRLVIGEVRGPEAFDMVQALNTGHDGSLSTVHANSPEDALRRVTALAGQGASTPSLEAVAEQVRSSIDVVVHLVRSADGRRHVGEVAEVTPPGSGGARVATLACGDRVMARLGRRRAAGDALMSWLLPFGAAGAAAVITTLSRRWWAGHVVRRLSRPAAPRRGVAAWFEHRVTPLIARRARVADDVAPTLDETARIVAAGASLAGALEEVGRVVAVQRPFAAELAGVMQRHSVGVPLADALAAAATTGGGGSGRPGRRRSGNGPERVLGLSVLELAARHGGTTAANLDRVAATIRERRTVAAERAVHSAQARLSALVLTLLPVGFSLWTAARDPRVRHFLVATPLGWACLVTGLGLNAAGWCWMRRIVRGPE